MIITRIHDLTGALVLDLSPANGWRRSLLTSPRAVKWRYGTVSSRYVDSEVMDGPATKAPISYAEQLTLGGDPTLANDPDAYWQSIDDRVEDLIEATSQRFLWVVSRRGYLYTYRSIGPADVDPTQVTPGDIEEGRIPVLLSFKTHPTPTREAP